jgi:hypothetical protein
LALLGIAWPPPKHWKKRVLGNCIDDVAAAKFLTLGLRQPPASAAVPPRIRSRAAQWIADGKSLSEIDELLRSEETGTLIPAKISYPD